jgi:ferredoxin
MPVAAITFPGSQATQARVVLLAAIVIAVSLIVLAATGRRRGRGGDGAEGGRPRGPSVTVHVDPIRCARFGYCEHEAPRVFQIRREGRLTYQARVRVGEIDPVVRAVEVCPARAITLGRMPRGY